MRVHTDCIPCFLRQALQAARFATDREDLHEKALRAVLAVISESSWTESASEIGVRVHATVMDIVGCDDPYKDEKRKSNETVLAMYEELRHSIEIAEDSLDRAILYAIAGNVMDYGAKKTFDILETLKHIENKHFNIDDSSRLKNDLLTARRIAYLADNAGEIVFDRLFIETVDRICGKKQWRLFVKERPILNDATMEEAIQAGFAGVDSVTLDVVGLDRVRDQRCEAGFRDMLSAFDVVIAKGQGNYEAMNDAAGMNLYHLLMIKCPLVARTVGAHTGDIVVMRAEP
ncbi:MAG: DUF89 family protein [Deltaproteobacteria bacterium]|nr:DUF89 family protein [Deltaproteobacteria bacterium]